MSKAEVLHWTPTDYLSDYKTRRLDLQEHGAYMLLLWHMWNDSDCQCEFPRDGLALASIWGVSPDEAMRLCDSLTEPGVALVKVIERKSGTVLQSKRLREQASAFENARQKNAKAGRQSGVVRRAKAANNRSTGVQHTLNESEPTVVPYLGSPDVSKPERESAPATDHIEEKEPPTYDALPECFSRYPTVKFDGIPLADFIPQAFERKFGMVSPMRYGAFCAAVKAGCLPGCDGSKKQCVWCVEHIDMKIGAKSERLLMMSMRSDREVVPPDARRR
jgi:uncharacterized protein YdaU (DUF1376 family)